MWEIIAAAVLCIFACLGFVAFVRALVFKICKPENDNTYIVIKADETTQDIEYILRSWWAKVKWTKKLTPNSIIIADNGLNEEQIKICRLICNECEMFRLCTPIEVYKILEEKNT